MPVIRRKLDPNTVYPEDLRYDLDTDTVQSNIDGEWVDNPDADPRNQTTFPPRLTSNPACDGAKSVTDAFKAQIDAVLVAIDNSATGFTIAGIILSLFTFGVFGVFISLALFIGDQMLAAGTAALEAALTGAVYDQFMCILNCHMTNQGRVKSGEFGQIKTDVTAQIGGLAGTILNLFLQLAGEGGVNNLASLGTSTGSCSGCDDCGIACGSPELVTLGTVVAEYIEEGRKVLTVQSVPFSTFHDISLGVYGQAAGEYPCCHIYAWVFVSGGAIDNTAFTNCGGTVFDPGNPETHDCAHAAWNSSAAPFVINIIFG